MSTAPVLMAFVVRRILYGNQCCCNLVCYLLTHSSWGLCLCLSIKHASILRELMFLEVHLRRTFLNTRWFCSVAFMTWNSIKLRLYCNTLCRVLKRAERKINHIQGYSKSLQLYSKSSTMWSCKLFEYPYTY